MTFDTKEAERCEYHYKGLNDSMTTFFGEEVPIRNDRLFAAQDLRTKVSRMAVQGL